MLMGKMLDVLTGTSESQCQILYHLIYHVLLVLLEKIKNQHGDEATVCLEDLDEHDRLAKVVELIGQWLQKVIGHLKFGGALSEKFRGEVRVSFSSSQYFVCQFNMYPMYRCGECCTQLEIQTVFGKIQSNNY